MEKEGWEVSSWENEAEEVVHYCYYYDYCTIQCLSLIWRIQVGMGVRESFFRRVNCWRVDDWLV